MSIDVIKSSPTPTTARSRIPWRRLAALPFLVAVTAFLSSCALPQIISAVGHNIEREKEIEVLSKYTGLENATVAVLIHADHAMLYEYPLIKPQMTMNISVRLQQNVSGTRILLPQHVLAWEYQTPTWSSMPMGQVCDLLDVDRVVYVDVLEFRLNPPGNRFMWEGLVVANVSVFERHGIDPDAPIDEFSVTSRFPDVRTITREQMRQDEVEAGLVGRFCQKVAWLFYDHKEDKYPDRNVKG